MENLSEKFLKLPLNTRRDILIQVLKTMDDKVFEELCFRLTAPEELLSVWDQKVEPTKEILKIMSKIFLLCDPVH